MIPVIRMGWVVMTVIEMELQEVVLQEAAMVRKEMKVMIPAMQGVMIPA